MKRAAIASMILLLSVLSCQVFANEPGSQGGGDQQPAAVDLNGYFLPDLSVGLEGLQSYTQTLSISFKGTREGKPVEFTDTYAGELNRQTNTQFTYMSIMDVEGTQEQIIAGNAGEAYYSKSGEQECHVSWGQRAEGVEPFVMTRLLPPLQGVDEAGAEEMNGVQARHYTFDAASLGYPSGTKVDGQVWLAVDGGYVVKYSMRIQDEGVVFGEGTKGEQIFEYELDQVNTVDGPPLPDGCPAVLTDFPAMADAFDIERLPQVLAYTSPSAASQISIFYEEQLQGLGWTMSSSHSYPQDGNTLVFLHAEDSSVAFITLEAAGTNTWVTVKVAPMEETVPSLVP